MAQATAYATGVLWSYFWNSRWTFSDAPAGSFFRFLVVQSACLAVSAGAVGALVDVLGFPATTAWLLVMALITIVNFIAVRYWAFGERHRKITVQN